MPRYVVKTWAIAGNDTGVASTRLAQSDQLMSSVLVFGGEPLSLVSQTDPVEVHDMMRK